MQKPKLSPLVHPADHDPGPTPEADHDHCGSGLRSGPTRAALRYGIGNRVCAQLPGAVGRGLSVRGSALRLLRAPAPRRVARLYSTVRLDCEAMLRYCTYRLLTVAGADPQ